jgi:hypothetical protein
MSSFWPFIKAQHPRSGPKAFMAVLWLWSCDIRRLYMPLSAIHLMTFCSTVGFRRLVWLSHPHRRCRGSSPLPCFGRKWVNLYSQAIMSSETSGTNSTCTGLLSFTRASLLSALYYQVCGVTLSDRGMHLECVNRAPGGIAKLAHEAFSQTARMVALADTSHSNTPGCRPSNLYSYT